MDSFGSPLQFTFAAATQQAIDLVSANRLTIGTSDEWVLALALAGNQPPWFDTFAEVRQTGAFVTSGRVERRLVAILAAECRGSSFYSAIGRPSIAPASCRPDIARPLPLRVHELIGAALERVVDGQRLGVGDPSML
jgi:hypothetical protein